MPVHGRQKRGPWGAKGLILGALALMVGVGCFFDLDVPSVPPNPPPPSITVLAPKPGDTLFLTSEVSVEAYSVNGVASVTVLCGPLDAGARQAFAWAAPPYQGLVDFSVCQGLTTPNPDGGSVPLLQLGFQALSDAGAIGEVPVLVQFNTAGPDISVQFPPTAQPNSPFTVTVTVLSGGPLSAFPVVLLAGAPADSVTASNQGGLDVYTVFFAHTPGLGTDLYPYVPDQPVPIEVLTDTDEVVRLTVQATVANGNTASSDLSVELTRVVWDRFIPGVPAQDNPITWAAEPVAYDGGLVLPLSTTSGGGAESVWIPARFFKDDGTFLGFDSSTLPGGLDGGYLAVGITTQGETLFFEPSARNGNFLLAPPPSSSTPLVPTNLVGLNNVNPPLTRVPGGDGGPDLLCLQDSVQACSDATFDSLTCFTPQLTTVRATSGIVETGPPDAGFVAGGGGRYLSPNAETFCGSAWNLVDLTNGTVSFGSTTDPNGTARDCEIFAVTRLLAVGDGTFVVQVGSSCDSTGIDEFPIFRVGPGPANGQSALLGVYTAPLGTEQQTQREVVGVLTDGRVVTLANRPPNTTFELWPPDGGPAAFTSPIAGLYDSADATQGALVARSVYSAADGSFAVLLSGAPLGVGVLAFGPDLRPLWFYLYTRITSTATSRLVSASSFQDVYLLDEFNSHAVSLRVEPPGTLLPPSNLTYATNPAQYTQGFAIAPNVPSNSGGAVSGYAVSPALPAGLSVSPTTGIISGTPTAVSAAASFIVTASNAAGGATTSLTITVNAAPDAGQCDQLCVTVSPSAVQVVPGLSTSFTISVAGPPSLNGNVTLTGTGSGGTLVGPAGVTISPNPVPSVYLSQGVEYEPTYLNASASVESVPGSPVDVYVTGTSADGGLSATIFTIQLVANTVTVSPPNVYNFPTNTSTQFSAQVEPRAAALTWSVDEGSAGGSVDSTGLYTSPAVLGTYHVRASITLDPTAYGEAVVQVTGG